MFAVTENMESRKDDNFGVSNSLTKSTLISLENNAEYPSSLLDHPAL